MRFRITEKTFLGALGVLCGLLFIVLGGGITVLLTLAGSIVTFIAAPTLLFVGKRHVASRLFAAWGIYLSAYILLSTGMAVGEAVVARTYASTIHVPAVGEEVCADAGCFAVDKVDIAAAAPESRYTLYWHLSNKNRELARRFPGKGLEIYMFDEYGRKFVLPGDANISPLDVTLPPGEIVRESMTFNIPADAHQLFLTAKYRPYTFQSLFPGILSLVPVPHKRMIRIQ